MEKKKNGPKVLLAIVLIIGLLAGFIAVNSSKNMKVMRNTISSGMQVLTDKAAITPADAGEFKEVKMYGLMKFDVDQYEVSEFGNLSVMTVNMGFMQMVSFVLTPYEKNMPLLSMDFMYILGNRKAYVEFYDLVPDKATPEYTAVMESIQEYADRFSDLDDVEATPAWYEELMTVVLHKGGKRADDARIEELFTEAVDTYISEAAAAGRLTKEEQTEKLELTQEFSDNLITKGGVSTDVFKKALGEEKTKEFFDKVFFGTERSTRE